MPYDLDRHISVVERLLSAQKAADSLLPYVRFTMPDPLDQTANPRTKYQTGRHHELLARTMEAVAAKKIRKVIITAPPRHGKTELATKRFIAWFSAKYPELHFIFGTYNATYAEDNGRAVRSIIQSPEHLLVFPDHRLKLGSEASDRLETIDGGQLHFVGRGGAATGRGGHGIVIDDPIKDRREADSKVIRDQLWTWYTQVISTRLMVHDGFIVIILTRWHEDDIVGRLTDPMNPYYDESEAAEWTIVDLPALALDDDVLGRTPGDALWPERFPAPFLQSQQRLDPRGFQALYQGRPSSDQGAFFTASMLNTYKPDELPKDLRHYVASDHAVTTAQTGDKTAMVVAGTSEDEDLYILPDTQWGKFPADLAVELMLSIMQTRKPVFWWAERGQITKAIGPFLRKRMAETSTYCALLEMTPLGDKQARATSIMGRMATGRVFFPAYAAWWPEARDQLLKFPHGTHDDFVDALALLGMGLGQQIGVNAERRPPITNPKSFRAMFARLAARRTEENSFSKAGW